MFARYVRLVVPRLSSPCSLRSLAAPGRAAQTSVSSADLQRLEDIGDAAAHRRRCAARARHGARPQLRYASSSEIADDVVYLKVKLRREGSVPRAEYTDLSDRVDRARATTARRPTSSTTSATSSSVVHRARSGAPIRRGAGGPGARRAPAVDLSSDTARSRIASRRRRSSTCSKVSAYSFPPDRPCVASSRRCRAPAVSNDAQPHAGVRSGHDQGARLSRARHRDPGTRERWL